MWQAGTGAAGPRLSSAVCPTEAEITIPQADREGGRGSHLDSRQLIPGRQESKRRPEPQAESPDDRLLQERSRPCPGSTSVPATLFHQAPSPLQPLPSPRDHTTHPPNRCAQEQKGKDHHSYCRYAHTPSDQEDDQISPSLGVGTQPVLWPEKSGNFCLFSFCLGYFLVCCAFIINKELAVNGSAQERNRLLICCPSTHWCISPGHANSLQYQNGNNIHSVTHPRLAAPPLQVGLPTVS